MIKARDAYLRLGLHIFYNCSDKPALPVNFSSLVYILFRGFVCCCNFTWQKTEIKLMKIYSENWAVIKTFELQLGTASYIADCLYQNNM